MLSYLENFGVGPWTVLGPFVPAEGRYRGQPTKLEVTLAIAFSGHTMIELVQQHNDAPSVFRETIGRSGYGFHHFAIVTRDFDAELAKYRSTGFEIAFSDRLLGSRIVYFDTTSVLPGMTELVEYSPGIEAAQSAGFYSAQNWDGSNPIRRMGPPPRT
jgi:hypothetical protein